MAEGEVEIELHGVDEGDASHSPKQEKEEEKEEEEAGGHGGEQLRVVEAAKDMYFGGPALEAGLGAHSDAIVVLHNIHKTYLLGVEGVPALRGVTLDVARGEFICIFGTSGGGKTSLLNIIGTIDKPTKGELFINKTRIAYNTADKVLSDLRLHDIGFVFQTFNLLSSLTAVENVEMPLILAGKMTAAERRERAIEVLEMVGMGDRKDHLPSQLSGGEQQRVTIARAIANRPKILLLDEPTGDLDTVNSAIVMKLLVEANRRYNITLIMVTHDVGLKYFANRIIWLRDGKIQRIEHVSAEKRNEIHRQLDEDMQELGLGRLHDGDEEAEEEEQGLKGRAHTTVRQPKDYRTHRDYDADHSVEMASFASHGAKR